VSINISGGILDWLYPVGGLDSIFVEALILEIIMDFNFENFFAGFVTGILTVSILMAVYYIIR
jgi:hypothetical protein